MAIPRNAASLRGEEKSRRTFLKIQPSAANRLTGQMHLIVS
jgi:hypothetical protein